MCKNSYSRMLLQVGSEFAVSKVEQQLQIKALRTLNACLTTLTLDAPQKFEGAPAASLLTAIAATMLRLLTLKAVVHKLSE